MGGTKHNRNSHSVLPLTSSSARRGWVYLSSPLVHRSIRETKRNHGEAGLARRMDRLSEMAEIALFRILQESLTNVHRHSGSSVVEVHLKASGNKAVFTVRDFGRGMPAGSIQGSQPNGEQFGVGLRG